MLGVDKNLGTSAVTSKDSARTNVEPGAHCAAAVDNRTLAGMSQRVSSRSAQIPNYVGGGEEAERRGRADGECVELYAVGGI